MVEPRGTRRRIRLGGGLRARLLLVVALVLVPSVALVLVASADQRQAAAARARAEARRLTVLVAGSVARTVEGSRDLLLALSRLPAVQDPASPACDRLLADMLSRFSQYANLGVANVEGDVVCSGLPSRDPVNIADRAYFRRALERETFAGGGYQIGRVTGRPGINFGLPLRGADRRIVGVAYVALDLDELERLASGVPLPGAAVVAIFDNEGRMLARHPNPGGYVGRVFPDLGVVRAARSRVEGTVDAVGPDGIARLYGFNEVDAAGGTLYVTVGFPAETVYGPADRELRRNLTLFTLVGLAALILAWAVGHRSIVRPARALAAAASKVSAGDLEAESGSGEAAGELGRLARAFDEMTASLRARDLEAKEAEQALRYSLETLRRTDAERRDLLIRLGQAQEIERKRIASDIHDDSLQVMVAASMRLEALRRSVTDPPTLAAIERLQSVVGESIDRLRRLMFDLSPPILERDGLAAALRAQLERLRAETGIHYRLVDELDGELRGEASMTLYRILQEALVNVRKHANARSVSIVLAPRDEGIHVRLDDDGTGISEEERGGVPGHLGLVTMRERAEVAGGWMRIRSRQEGGTRVEAWIPLQDQSDPEPEVMPEREPSRPQQQG